MCIFFYYLTHVVPESHMAIGQRHQSPLDQNFRNAAKMELKRLTS